MTRKVSRHQFVAKAAAATVGAGTAGILFGRASLSADAATSQSLDGVTPNLFALSSGMENGALLLRDPADPSAGPTRRLAVAPDANVWRVGPAKLTDFAVGDEVVARGTWLDASTFMADQVAPPLHSLYAKVSRRDGATLETSAGTIRTSAATRAITEPPYHRVGPGAVESGNDIFALAIWNVDTSSYFAAELGAR
jgi:hypothetical protein